MVFTRFTRNGSSRLLFSEKSQDRFSEWLKRTCTSNEELLLAMGSVLDEMELIHSERELQLLFLAIQEVLQQLRFG